jgi:hypothetical protein
MSEPESEQITPRAYIHSTCGGGTQMPDDVIANYLADPWYYYPNDTTYCFHCKRYVPQEECTWQETNENLSVYFQNLRAGVPQPIAVIPAIKIGLMLVFCFGLGGILLFNAIANSKGGIEFKEIYPGVCAILVGLILCGGLYYGSRPPRPESGDSAGSTHET